MIKFDLSDSKDHAALQERLDWISSNTINSPDWVWLAACSKLEADCGLPEGFFNADIPGFSNRKQTLTVAIVQEYAPRTIRA